MSLSIKPKATVAVVTVEETAVTVAAAAAAVSAAEIREGKYRQLSTFSFDNSLRDTSLNLFQSRSIHLRLCAFIQIALFVLPHPLTRARTHTDKNHWQRGIFLFAHVKRHTQYDAHISGLMCELGFDPVRS